MKRHGRLVVALPVFAMIGLCGCGSSGGGSVEETAIRGQVSRAMTCVQNLDVTGFMACVAPDFKEDGTTRDDVEGILTLIAPEIVSIQVSYSIDVSRISGDRATATLRGHLQITGVDPANTGRIPQTGEMTLSMVCKREGGQWLAYGNQRNTPAGKAPFETMLREAIPGLHR